MELNTQTRQCENCLKFFPQDKVDLHEAYCCRNIRRCKKCDQMVDIKDQQQHQTDFHMKTPCSLCKAEFDKEALEKHIDQCPRRPVLCKYCENQIASQQHSKHQDVCGARTKQCQVCQKPIMIKDLQEHQSRCQRRRQERAEVSQDQYRQHRRNQVDRPLGERDRQTSTNNIREKERSNSIQRISKPTKVKPSNVIGPETIKPVIDPVPISIRIAMRAKQQQRVPLKSKN